MKKRTLLYSLAVCLMASSFTSCNNDNDEYTDTTITYYVDLSLKGPELLQVPVGTKFVDPGCNATLNGKDYSSQVKVTGANEVDVNKVNVYTLTYSAVNQDGYPASIQRKVAVCDPSITVDMSGNYVTAEGTQRVFKGATTPFPGIAVSIKRVAPGLFSVSDIIGGYYSNFKGYGDKYAMQGYFILDKDNNFTPVSALIPAWGDSYQKFSDGKYDPETHTLSWVCEYVSKMTFTVKLKLN